MIINNIDYHLKHKSFKFNRESLNLISNSNYIDFNIDRLLNKIKDKKTINKIIIILGISLFLASNPTSSFALSSLETFKENGLMLVNQISDILIQGIIILTIFRLLYEYIQGANDYRIFDVLKESIGAIALLIILPKIPTIFNLIIK